MNYVHTMQEDINSFAVIGDVHLHHLSPRSRIDNYPETLLDKLESLRVLLLQQNISVLFILGDLFHKAKEPCNYEYKVVEQFLKFKDSGITVFSIVGNHDILYDRLDTLKDSSLGVLFLTDTIKPFERVKFKGFTVYGCNFPNKVPVPDKGVNILLAHMFYNSDMDKDSLTAKTLDSRYSCYFLGHDHTPYQEENVNGIKILRPGAFSRGTSHSYNISRDIQYIIYRNGDITTETVPCLPSSECFSLSSTDSKKDLKAEYSKKINELVYKISHSSTNRISIFTLLDDKSISKNVKDRILQYLEAEGYYRN